MPLSTREMFARMIRCEAGGEGDAGMRAVASIIMNRVHVDKGEYLRVGQGDLRKIMLQPGQFDCAREIVGGKPNSQNIYNIPAEPIHFQIADWALGGGNFSPIANSLWYYNPYKDPCRTYFPGPSGRIHTKVNHHCTYHPTPAYADT